MGCLMYATICIRLNLAQIVSVVSKFWGSPRRQHWDAVVWIFRHSRGTTDCGIMFRRQQNNPSVVGYIDSDYAGDWMIED